MNNELLQLTLDFNKVYKTTAAEITASILLGRTINKVLLEKRIVKKIKPLIDNMFIDGMAASNKVVKIEVAKLVTNYNIPYKYNKDLLLKMNGKSIFTGYFDKHYKGLFTNAEIDKLKRVILSAKYGKWTEMKTLKNLQKITNMTGKRALLLARNETTRLTTVANQLYFQKKEVRNEFDLVWFNSGDNIRPAHREMAGKKADENGMFNSPLCGLVQGPPLSCDPYNCKCFCDFIKKEDV